MANALDEAASLLRKPTPRARLGAQEARASAFQPDRRTPRPSRPRPSTEVGRGQTGRRPASPPSSRRYPRGPGRSPDQANPGISPAEVAKKMKIKPNYLYRVLGELEKEGRVKKSGRSYTAA